MYIHSWKKSKIVDKIGRDKYLEVQFHKIDSIGKQYTTSYGGILLYAFPDKIIMNIDDESAVKRMENGTTIHSTYNYSIPDSISGNVIGQINTDKRNMVDVLSSPGNANNQTVRTININSIYSIYYSKSKKVANVGIGLMVVSGITALLVAPPVSINFRTGHFNQNTYYSMLAASGACFAIGLPLYTIFTKTHQYRIKNYAPDANDNNYYSIQTK